MVSKKSAERFYQRLTISTEIYQKKYIENIWILFLILQLDFSEYWFADNQFFSAQKWGN